MYQLLRCILVADLVLGLESLGLGLVVNSSALASEVMASVLALASEVAALTTTLQI
jgi:hypothetical protein